MRKIETNERTKRPLALGSPRAGSEILKVFELGLTSVKGPFAKRRMGKSEFLEKDLIPAARQAGYLATYLNLADVRWSITRGARPTC